LYGGVPEITINYPAHVWWPRARNAALQALGAAKSGHYEPQPAPSASPAAAVSRRVFIVHGRDHGLKEAVARLISKLGYQPVILHEQANRGQTVIEKFEAEAPDAAFAVILLTPDDQGSLRTEKDSGLKPRARQNVVFEFGYFAGLIGRNRVAALVPEDEQPESPSDLSGLLYIQVRSEEDEGWRLKLAREMKAVGLDIDLNKVVT
jgi:predicted nucleotide-binding protein